jgi:hypothetical protein
MGGGIDATTTLTGMLPMIVLIAAVLTAPVAALLLARYRRAVIRSMGETAGSGTPVARSAAAGAAPAYGSLVLSELEAERAAPDNVLYRRAQHSLVTLCTLYAAAGLAYASVMAIPWMVFAAEDGFVLSRFVWLVACYAWPVMLAAAIVAATSGGERASLAGGYLLLLALSGLYGLLRNPEFEAAQLAVFWLIVNGPPSLLLLAFLHRRVRAVGPLVAAFMLAAVTGSQLLLSWVGASERGMVAAVDVGRLFGLGGTEVFFALIVVGFILFALLGWWLLHRVGTLYRRRALSDQMLTLDALWLLFAIAQSITFAFEGWGWIMTGAVAFAAYKTVALLGFRLVRAGPPQRAPMLLLLRVFALGRRSERVFDALAKRWLRIGSITMIAGPDLVASTVEPHEILDFVGGGIAHRFVRSDEDLVRRMQALELDPDPDGRYRVNELFCYADTWQSAMQALARAADAVVMDLRSFAPDNQGCLYEIEQLLATVDLRQVLLLVDETTDETFLRQALQSAWTRVAHQAPSARHESAQLRLLRLSGSGRQALRSVFRALTENAAVAEARITRVVPA